MQKVIVEGFNDNGKSFYPVDCYLARLNNVDGAVVVPRRTRHDQSTIEFIAPVSLREELKLKDGDEVLLESK